MSYAMVTLQELDVSKITFGKPKQNQYKATNIPIYYQKEDKNIPLYISLKACSAPFGIYPNREFNDGKKINGYGISFSMNETYSEKIKGLDQYLIETAYQNRKSWGLNEKIPKQSISGYDEFGTEGKYKRLLKYPYHINNNGEKVYDVNKYLPRIDTKIISNLNEEPHQLDVVAFDDKREKVDSLTSKNYKSSLPAGSKVSSILLLSRISIGTYGIVLKPIAKQLLIKKVEFLPNDEFLLEDDEEEDIFD